MQEGNTQECWWPPRTANTPLLMTNYTSPNYDTWDRYEIEIIKYCTCLESARKSAADATYNTTDEERLGRGKRQHIPYHRFSSDEDESHEEEKKKKMKKKQSYSVIPAAPENFSLSYERSNEDTNMDIYDIHQNEMRSEHDKENLVPEQSQQLELSNVPIIIKEHNPSAHKSSHDTKMQESMNILLRMQAASNLKLKDLKQRIINIEDLLKQRTPMVPESDNLIAHFLPLDSVEMIRELDSKLKSCDEAVTQFKGFLIKIGGNNPRDNIHRLLKKTFTNKCALHCSWKGIRNNFRLCDLYLIKIMQREITLRYTGITEIDFENITAEWFRFAQQRKKREDKNQEREQE